MTTPTPETHICTGHFEQPCGHMASNHGALGCTACGCRHSDAWVKYQGALAEIAALKLRLAEAERLKALLKPTLDYLRSDSALYKAIRAALAHDKGPAVKRMEGRQVWK